MKGRRHAMILEAIRQRPIGTQAELTQYLRSRGIAVTQATVSRDIKELRLVKVATGQGGYRYALPADRPGENALERARRILGEFVTSVESSGNLIVLKTPPGSAHTVGAALDALQWPEILGTVGGDDSLLVVVRVAPSPEPSPAQEAAARLVQRLLELRG
ncbi:MAG TPA: arginine repressor [Firmicutes bacterium]|nr:arginine repressor [Bacillota bacterium]